MNEMSAKAATAPSPRLSIALKFGDADILLLYSAALFVISGVQKFLEGASFNVLFEFNAGEMLALCAVYIVVKSKSGAIALTRTDLAVIAACSLFMLPPVSQHFAFFGASLAGLYFLLRKPRDSRLFDVGLLWLALSTYETFGRLLFKLISGPLMQLELFFIAKIGPWLGFSFVRDGIRLVSPSGWYVYMMEQCSSFHNISLALLIWLSLLKIASAEVRRPQFVALGVAIFSIILLNAFRVMLMTLSPPAHYFWHFGAGSLLFSSATFLAVALPTAVSLRRGA